MKTSRTKENILVLIQLWAINKEKFTSKELAEFLGTTRRNASNYVLLLMKRGIVKREKGYYVLERLDDKAGKLLEMIVFRAFRILDEIVEGENK